MSSNQSEQTPDDASKTEQARVKPKRRKRKRTSKNRDEHVWYEIRVTGWDGYYGFRVSDPKSRYDPGPYSEIATVTITGHLLRPENMNYKTMSLTLSGHERIKDER